MYSHIGLVVLAICLAIGSDGAPRISTPELNSPAIKSEIEQQAADKCRKLEDELSVNRNITDNLNKIIEMLKYQKKEYEERMMKLRCELQYQTLKQAEQKALKSNLSDQLRNLPNSCIPFNYSMYVHEIQVHGSDPFKVKCDGKTAGPGWTVIQQRVSGNMTFTRSPAFYGSFDDDFFLGLKNIYLMTKEEQYALRIYIKSGNGTEQYVEYDDFSISSAADEYRVKSLGRTSDKAGQLVKNGTEFFDKNLQNRSLKMLMHPMRRAQFET